MSLATYEGKPVILTHDAGRVTPQNTDAIVGTILTKGFQDGGDVRAKIVIHDIDTVKQSAFRELSLGYTLILDETPGEWEGQPYDAIQTEIAINHLAVVREARAGEQARLNIDSKQDEPKGEKDMAQEKKPTPAAKKTNTDDLKKSVAAFEERRKRRLDEAEAAAKDAAKSDAESAVVEEVKASGDNPPAADKPTVEDRVKLITDRRGNRDAEGDPADVDAAKGVIAQQDEDIGALLEMVEELCAAKDIAVADKKDSSAADADDPEGDLPAQPAAEKPMNADSVDAAVTERLKLIRIGDRLNLEGLESCKPLEAKKRIIKAIKPDLRLDGKSATYISTAFDIAVQELNSRKDTAYQRQQMFNADSKGGHAQSGKSKSQEARENMLARMQNGGKE
jgi:hypothetical protein